MPNEPMLITIPPDYKAAADRLVTRRKLDSRSELVRELIREALPERERRQLSEPGKRGRRCGSQ